MNAIEKIRQTVDEICEKNNLKQPMTVPASAKLIMEYKGIKTARELFSNAAKETNDFFKKCAYEATLETILK
jgi:hypothetical protein